MEVQYDGKTGLVCFIVVENGTSSVLGRKFMNQFGLQLTQVSNVRGHGPVGKRPKLQQKPPPQTNTYHPEGAHEIFKKYTRLFRNEIGCCKWTKVSLAFTEDLKPVFRKHRELPIHYRDAIEKKLNELEAQGMIEKVDNNEYGTPLVVVKKPNGELIICGDYKATINQYLKSFNYPIPSAGSEVFEN